MGQEQYEQPMEGPGHRELVDGCMSQHCPGCTGRITTTDHPNELTWVQSAAPCPGVECEACNDDTVIRDLVRPILGELATDGTSDGVPSIVDVVEILCQEIIRLRALVELENVRIAHNVTARQCRDSQQNELRLGDIIKVKEAEINRLHAYIGELHKHFGAHGQEALVNEITRLRALVDDLTRWNAAVKQMLERNADQKKWRALEGVE